MEKLKSWTRSTGKRILAGFLCVALIGSTVPEFAFAAQTTERNVIELYDYEELSNLYLAQNQETINEYPNGAYMFPLSSAQLEMNNFYAMDVFREGGTKGDSAITVKTMDLTAEYGKDYEIYLSKEPDAKPVEGEANPYYDLDGYSFIATHTKTETSYLTNEAENLDEMRDIASENNDEALELMPTSSEFTLKFKDGENSKRIYIKTSKKFKVTDDLEFTLNLCEPENGSIGVQSGLAVTITERREKPETFLSIQDVKVNPGSEEAYIVVKRSGNMGTKGTFTIRTESDTAKAGEAYEAVQLPLNFTPGMREIKVPVKMLEGAKDGTYFKAHLEDIENAANEPQVANVKITSNVAKEEARQSAFTATETYSTQTIGSSIVNSNTGKRGVQIVDVSKFSVSAVTDRGSFSHKSKFSNTGSNARKPELWYTNGMGCATNALSIKSNETIDFTGVQSITVPIDIYTGSCEWDDTMVYVADKDQFSSSTDNFDWVGNLDNEGIGDSWGMGNVSDDFLLRTATLNQDKVRGDRYLFLGLLKSGFMGECSYGIYNYGVETLDHNVQLNMIKYEMSIIEPDTVELYVNGSLTKESVAKNHKLVDPAANKDNDSNASTSVSIYRDETTVISAAVDSKYKGLANIKGVYFCESGNTSNHSELYEFTGNSLTLTSDILEKYAGYIKNNKIVIKPVYEVSQSNLSVESYDNTATGQRFVADNNSNSGKFYHNDELIGTLSWTKSTRDGGKYLVADTLNFKFTYADNVPSQLWQMKLDTRAASSKSQLSTSTITTFDNGTFSYNVQLTDIYFSVTPQFTLKDTTTVLNIKNPELGDFTGKGSKYALTNSDGSVTLKGYTKDEAGSDIVFSNMSVNEIITFFCQPKEGYRAKWTYRDSATHQTKTYYGNSFFYVIQNPYYDDDNHVTLTFEESPVNRKYWLFGQIFIQEGSVINPPTAQTDIYNVAGGAQISIDEYVAVADEDGEFRLETAPGEENSVPGEVYGSPDEVHRALIFYNNQYHVQDIDFGEYLTSSKVTSIGAKIKMNYKNEGVSPVSIYAQSADGILYNDTITLISANAVQFFMTIDTKGQLKDKPVNLVRWTIENDEGIKHSFDVELEEGETLAKWASTLSEIVKQGDKLYAELMWKGYDEDAEAIYTSYGKFDTGYNFVATSVLDTITYAPEIGMPVTMTKPTPVIGGVSPMFSVKGVTPIINIGTIGTDSEGHELHTITLGFSFSLFKNVAQKDSSWTNAKIKDKAKKLMQVADFLDIYQKNDARLGRNVGNTINLKTAVNVSFSVTFCYQGSYYVDEDGQWLFTGHLGIMGAGGSIRISIPFVLLCVPCFVYMTASIDANMFIGVFPKTDVETGETVALTLDQLDDSELSEFQGVYELRIGLGIGAGVGYDALVSVQGGVDCKFDIQFNNYMRGYGDFTIGGSIAIEVLFLKLSYSESIFTLEMFNTLGNSRDVSSYIQSSLEEDIMNNVTIGDMKIASSQAHEQTVRAAASGSAIIQGTTSVVDPEIIALGGGKYLIVSTATTLEGDGKGTENVLHYYIYDEQTGSLTDPKPVLRTAYEQYMDNGGKADSRKASNLLEDYVKIDSEPTMVDCGDDILIAWNKCMINTKDAEGNDQANDKLFNSLGVSTIYYNKESGKFHDYKVINDKEKKYLFTSPRLAYNENTGETQIFYQAMSSEGITAETTLAELQEKPIALRTARYDSGENNWSDGQNVSINGKHLKYYDAAAYEDTILLSYISSDFSGFTLESAEDFETDGTFDKSQFNTENALFIRQYTAEGGDLKASNPIRLTNEGYVVANPEFVRIDGKLPTETVTGKDSTTGTEEIDNTLLMYKCNGRYAYQNITNILTNGLYTSQDGMSHISEDYAEPQFITDEEDYSVNDDFSVYSDNKGNIYALWTTTESNQQQIWAKQFVFDRMEKLTKRVVLDADGKVKYDGSNNPVMEDLENPIYLLNGYWGGKTYLTDPIEVRDMSERSESDLSGLVEGTGDGLGQYKKNFDALVLDNGEILAVFNGYDKKFVDEAGADGQTATVCKEINNLFAVAKYGVASKYELLGDLNCIDVSDDYPAAGDTVQVTCYAKNSGIKSGRNVEVTLYANGNEVDTKTEDTWLAAETKAFNFQYTLPKDKKADEVSLYFTVEEKGLERRNNNTSKMTTADRPYTFSQGVDLDIVNVILSPISNVSDDSGSARIKVKATVRNNGNEAYAGGDYVKLVDKDIKEWALSVRDDYQGSAAILTALGKEMIKPLAVGESYEVEFISDEIPASVFEKSGMDVAYLECIISSASEKDWKTRNADEEYSEMAFFYPGVTRMPIAETVDSIEADDMKISVGETTLIAKNVSPAAALANSKITYTSSNPEVVTVDENGIITGVGEGTATITLSVDGLTATSVVTVAGKYVPEDNTGNGDDANPGDIPLIPGGSSGAQTGDTAGNSLAVWMLIALAALTVCGIAYDQLRKKKAVK